MFQPSAASPASLSFIDRQSVNRPPLASQVRSPTATLPMKVALRRLLLEMSGAAREPSRTRDKPVTRRRWVVSHQKLSVSPLQTTLFSLFRCLLWVRRRKRHCRRRWLWGRCVRLFDDNSLLVGSWGLDLELFHVCVAATGCMCKLGPRNPSPPPHDGGCHRFLPHLPPLATVGGGCVCVLINYVVVCVILGRNLRRHRWKW